MKTVISKCICILFTVNATWKSIPQLAARGGISRWLPHLQGGACNRFYYFIYKKIIINLTAIEIMKNKMIIIGFILVSFATVAQEKKITWDYPVKPGTEEWKKCNSPEEIYQALQIPENVLKGINTESLVQICLNYPATTVFHIFNTPQQGFDGFYKQFNGIQELMRRKDAGVHLLNKYADMSMKDFNPLWTLEEQGKFVEKFYYMELFLVQPVIMQSFSKEERKILMKESLNKFDMKLSRGDLFGGLNPMATVWIMARVLHTENKLSITAVDPSTITHSLESGLLTDFDAIAVYQQVKSYSNE